MAPRSAIERGGRIAQTSALELAGHISHGIANLESTYAPHVVPIFYPERWRAFRDYRTEAERFDVPRASGLGARTGRHRASPRRSPSSSARFAYSAGKTRMVEH